MGSSTLSVFLVALMFLLFGGSTLYLGITCDNLGVIFAGGFVLVLGGLLVYGGFRNIYYDHKEFKDYCNSKSSNNNSISNKNNSVKEVPAKTSDLSFASHPGKVSIYRGTSASFLILGIVMIIFGFIGARGFIILGIVVLVMSLYMFLIYRKQVRAFEDHSFIKEDIYNNRPRTMPQMIKEEITETYDLGRSKNKGR